MGVSDIDEMTTLNKKFLLNLVLTFVRSEMTHKRPSLKNDVTRGWETTERTQKFIVLPPLRLREICISLFPYPMGDERGVEHIEQ